MVLKNINYNSHAFTLKKLMNREKDSFYSIKLRSNVPYIG